METVQNFPAMKSKEFIKQWKERKKQDEIESKQFALRLNFKK
jgi:hypothetical protein